MNESDKINIEQLHKAGEDGDAEAQFQLGEYYRHEGNAEQGVLWYQKAAQQGHAGAQYALGLCCEDGIGVDIDYIQAVYWYQKAAEQGHADAQENLGYCYLSGLGVEKDEGKAFIWFKKAAEQGSLNAQRIVLKWYYNGNNGIGVKKSVSKAKELIEKYAKDTQIEPCFTARMYRDVLHDDVHAFLWYLKDTNDGDIPEGWEIEQFQLYGKGIDEYIDPDLTKYTEAAKSDPEYAWSLGVIYYLGSWVKADKQKAIEWFDDAGNKDAGYYWRLGDLFNYGRNDFLPIDKWEQNTVEAEKWYIKAAEKELLYAVRLACNYLYNWNMQIDLQKAESWYIKSGKQLLEKNKSKCSYDPIKNYVLGYYYFIQKNYKKAVKHYLKASGNGDNDLAIKRRCDGPYEVIATMYYHIGVCYYYGWGNKHNQNAATDWLIKATSMSVIWSGKERFAKLFPELFPILRTLAEEENNAAAQYGLGLSYENGNGVEKNDKLAVEWYQKAAENGDLDAIFEMGDRYLYGDGVTEDNKTASRLFHKAAEQGYIPAIELLEENGRDVSGYQRLHDGKAVLRRVRFDRSK